MITLFKQPSRQSCRKAIKFLTDNNIPFVVRDISKEPITYDELQSILKLTMNGVTDILSTHSHKYRTMEKEIQEMTLSELHTYLVHNHTLIKNPIIIYKEALLVGYNQEEYQSLFMSKEARRSSLNRIIETLRAEDDKKYHASLFQDEENVSLNLS